MTNANVEYAVKDATAPKGAAPEPLLNGVRDAVGKAYGGKLVHENKVTLLDGLSRELMIELPEKMYAHVRIYLVKDRLVQLVVKVQSKYLSPVAESFFASLKFKGDEKPTEPK